LHDIYQSRKVNNLLIRSVKLKNGDIYRICPSQVLPYLSGLTEEVAKGLLLRHWAVPYEVIAALFGRDAMYWQRLEEGLGRLSLVGSVVKAQPVPRHLAADEKITFFNGEEVYIALTAGADCVLGAELSLQEDGEGLQAAYGVFKEEAQQTQPDYQPLSVNLDGWKATHFAWKKLFTDCCLVLCFLHAFLKIRDLSRSMKAGFGQVSTKIWELYRQESRASFVQGCQALENWAEQHLSEFEKVKLKVKDLCGKVNLFAVAYDYPACYRTSNQIDRPMNLLDRYVYQIRYFHGHRQTANLKVRAWAMLYNFMPLCNRVRDRKVKPKKQSRFEELNGFVYHHHWLNNLLIASSMNGHKARQ